MSVKIFFSWQSDRLLSHNKDFIRAAIDAAMEVITGGAEVEGRSEIEITSDTTGRFGLREIFPIIRQRIEDCHIFIADLTFVAEYDREHGSQEQRHKYTPNPNVMIEFGYAMRNIQHAKIITVMNEAHGKPLHNLPFDLSGFVHPETFTLANDADEITRDAAFHFFVKKLRKAIEGSLKEVSEAQTQEQAETDAETMPRRREQIEGEWSAFKRQVDENKYHGLQAKIELLNPEQWVTIPSAYMAMGIFPLKPLNNPIDIERLRMNIGGKIQPLGITSLHSATVHTYGDSVVLISGTPARLPLSVLELKTSGVIVASTHIEIAEMDFGNKIYFDRDEKILINYLHAYLQVLREFDVTGPLEVRVFVKAPANTRFNDPRSPTSRFFRPTDKTDIDFPPAIIPANLDLANVQLTAKAVRKSFLKIWLDMGHEEGDPCFLTPEERFISG